MRVKSHTVWVFCCFAILCATIAGYADAQNPIVMVETNLGKIAIELYPQAAPVTVDNFLFYVRSGFYDELLFHRAISGFMIQGGGFYLNGYTIIFKPATAAIVNESYNHLSNLRGTIAMARTDQPDSATSQFFINHVDNLHLDRNDPANKAGYCVFGRVIAGMDVVDAIAQVQTCYVSVALADFPCNPPVIMSQVYVLPSEFSYGSDLAAGSGITFSDFAAFASKWLDDDCRSANAFCDGADLDYRGNVDIADLDLFMDHWNRQAGYEAQLSDFSGDQTINLADLASMAAGWLSADCSEANQYCGGTDINHSGTCNLADFALFSANWLVNY